MWPPARNHGSCHRLQKKLRDKACKKGVRVLISLGKLVPPARFQRATLRLEVGFTSRLFSTVTKKWVSRHNAYFFATIESWRSFLFREALLCHANHGARRSVPLTLRLEWQAERRCSLFFLLRSAQGIHSRGVKGARAVELSCTIHTK
jgi:hypothetical protein